MSQQEFEDRQPLYLPYRKEVRFFTELSNGNEAFIAESLREEPFFVTEEAGYGLLSHNPTQNAKYHFYGTALLAARYCVERGMNYSQAMDLAYSYTRRADLAKSEQEVASLHAEMCLLMCRKMQEILRHQNHPRSIRDCLDYIYTHVHERILLTELAGTVRLSESYLSRQFKKEMGVSLGEYILHAKVEEARGLLSYSGLSIVEIADSLSFSSQSHFTKVFKKETGVTPRKYREEHFRADWSFPGGQETGETEGNVQEQG